MSEHLPEKLGTGAPAPVQHHPEKTPFPAMDGNTTQQLDTLICSYSYRAHLFSFSYALSCGSEEKACPCDLSLFPRFSPESHFSSPPPSQGCWCLCFPSSPIVPRLSSPHHAHNPPKDTLQTANSLEYAEAFLFCNAGTQLHVTAFKEFVSIIFTFCIFNASKNLYIKYISFKDYQIVI